jgi:hypothetical protein
VAPRAQARVILRRRRERQRRGHLGPFTPLWAPLERARRLHPPFQWIKKTAFARRGGLPAVTAARAQQHAAVRFHRAPQELGCNSAGLCGTTRPLAFGPLFLGLLALAVLFYRAAHGGVLSRRGKGACCAVLHSSARRPFHKRHWLAAKAAAVSKSHRQQPGSA